MQLQKAEEHNVFVCVCGKKMPKSRNPLGSLDCFSHQTCVNDLRTHTHMSCAHEEGAAAAGGLGQATLGVLQVRGMAHRQGPGGLALGIHVNPSSICGGQVKFGTS